MTTEPFDIDRITLDHGKHSHRSYALCVMEAVAWHSGVRHTDAPPCTDLLISAYARRLNDLMPYHDRQRLKPYIERLDGARLAAAPVEAAMKFADRAVRVHAPMALRAAGLDEHAERLAALAPVTDKESADAADYAASNAAVKCAADARVAGSKAAIRLAYDVSNAARCAAYDVSSAPGRKGHVTHIANHTAFIACAASAANGDEDIWAEPLAMLDELLALCEPKEVA